MLTDAVIDGGVGALHKSFNRRAVSPVEVAQVYLERIASLDDSLHAFTLVTADHALAQARRSERRYASREPFGRLDGVPVAVKDVFDTAGIPTTGQSAAFADRVPNRDAVAVAKLAAAGAVLLGKLALTELGFGVPDPSDMPPPTRNPWNLALSPGGSSSGPAAAVSAGLCVAALGTDTGGSVRDPAACCGVVGMKPTYDLVSRTGCMPLAPSFDHCGPLARTVGDCRDVLAVVSGRRFESGRPLERLRIGVPRGLIDAVGPIDREIEAAFATVLSWLESLGALVSEVTIAELEHEPAVYATILAAETLATHGQDAASRPELFGRSVVRRLVAASALSDADVTLARRGRSLVVEAVERAMAVVDVLVLPTREQPAQPFGTRSNPWLLSSLRHPFNVTGQPAVSVPCGFTSAGLPIGLQLVGRRGDDARLLSVAAAYEHTHQWVARRPELVA